MINLVYYGVAALTFFLCFYIYKNRKTQLNTITAIMLLSLGLAPFSWTLKKLNIQYLDDIWILYFPFLLLFALIFPFEHSFIKDKRYVKYAIFVPYFIYFMAIIAFLMLDMFILSKNGNFTSGVIRFGIIAVATRLYTLLLLGLNLVYGIAAFAILSQKKKTLAGGIFYNQINYLLFGIRIFVAVFILDFFGNQCKLLPSIITEEATNFLYLVAILSNIVLLSLSMVKYKFLNIEMKARGVLYYFMLGLFVTVYCVAYSTIARFLIINDYDRWFFFFTVASFLIYIIFHRGVQKMLTYFFIKNTIDYEEILTTFFAKLLQADSLNEVRTLVVNELRLIFNMHDTDLIQVDSIDISYKQLKKYFILSEMPEKIRSSCQWGVYFFPIMYEESFFGFLVIGNKQSKKSLPKTHLNIIRSVATQISLTLHTSAVTKEAYEKRILEKELNLARKIQLSLLPPKDIVDDTLDIGWRYNPAIKVGGDYCDIIENKITGDLVFVVADVSGKGVNGALYMSMIRTLLHTGIEYVSIEGVLLNMNAYIRQKIPEKTFVTMVVFVYNKKNGSLKYVHLGHTQPLHYCAKTDTLEILPAHGMALGLVPNDIFQTKFTVVDIDLQQGDFIFSYTDGITEAQNANGAFYGDDRLFAMVERQRKETIEKIINKVSMDIYDFRNNFTQTDDIAILAFSPKTV